MPIVRVGGLAVDYLMVRDQIAWDGPEQVEVQGAAEQTKQFGEAIASKEK